MEQSYFCQACGKVWHDVQSYNNHNCPGSQYLYQGNYVQQGQSQMQQQMPSVSLSSIVIQITEMREQLKKQHGEITSLLQKLVSQPTAVPTFTVGPYTGTPITHGFGHTGPCAPGCVCDKSPRKE